MASLDTWSAYNMRVAVAEAAKGNDVGAAAYARDAHRAAYSEMGFGPACVRNSRARRQLAGGAEPTLGLFFHAEPLFHHEERTA